MSLTPPKKTVAIMQPTYLPWLGYFSLMKSVDLFILLDSVQFSRRSWQQRNQIKTASGPMWLTVPVLSKGKRDQLIREVEIDRGRDFPQNHQKALELNYKRAPNFNAYMPELLSILNADNIYLTDLTIGLITWLKNALGIVTPLCRSSEFNAVGANAELLASLCEQVGATEYVSPPGSKDYLETSDAFARRGLPLHYFSFAHPQYPQLYGDFISHMSTVDLLFNCGAHSVDLIGTYSEVSK